MRAHAVSFRVTRTYILDVVSFLNRKQLKIIFNASIEIVSSFGIISLVEQRDVRNIENSASVIKIEDFSSKSFILIKYFSSILLDKTFM